MMSEPITFAVLDSVLTQLGFQITKVPKSHVAIDTALPHGVVFSAASSRGLGTSHFGGRHSKGLGRSRSRGSGEIGRNASSFGGGETERLPVRTVPKLAALPVRRHQAKSGGDARALHERLNTLGGSGDRSPSPGSRDTADAEARAQPLTRCGTENPCRKSFCCPPLYRRMRAL